jgi:hypothetical protein
MNRSGDHDVSTHTMRCDVCVSICSVLGSGLSGKAVGRGIFARQQLVKLHNVGPLPSRPDSSHRIAPNPPPPIPDP